MERSWLRFWNRRLLRLELSLCLVLVAAFQACASAPVAPPGNGLQDGQHVTLSSRVVVDGGLLIVKIQTPVALRDLRARFAGKHYPFAPVRPGYYQSLVAVPFLQEPGVVDLELVGEGFYHRVPIEVVSGKYKAEVLKVDPDKVTPPPEVMPRIESEIAEVGQIYQKQSSDKLWSGRFVLPIRSRMTSPFGTKRIYNGELRNAHKGIDLKARVGTAIYAPAGGIVVLAKDLYYTGNTILLDHGLGFYTLYAHMTKIKVRVGTRVARGKWLGTAGATGRVTGPHLHWAAIIGGEKINPLDLTRLDLE